MSFAICIDYVSALETEEANQHTHCSVGTWIICHSVCMDCEWDEIFIKNIERSINWISIQKKQLIEPKYKWKWLLCSHSKWQWKTESPMAPMSKHTSVMIINWSNLFRAFLKFIGHWHGVVKLNDSHTRRKLTRNWFSLLIRGKNAMRRTDWCVYRPTIYNGIPRKNPSSWHNQIRGLWWR